MSVCPLPIDSFWLRQLSLNDFKVLRLCTQHDADGKAYYTFEFIAQAPTYTRHALGTICIGNGMKFICSRVKFVMCIALNLPRGCCISLINKLQKHALQLFPYFRSITSCFTWTKKFDSGKFYTLTTGAKERRWGKMKDKLQTVVDSFQIVNLWVSSFFIRIVQGEVLAPSNRFTQFTMLGVVDVM